MDVFVVCINGSRTYLGSCYKNPSCVCYVLRYLYVNQLEIPLILQRDTAATIVSVKFQTNLKTNKL